MDQKARSDPPSLCGNFELKSSIQLGSGGSPKISAEFASTDRDVEIEHPLDAKKTARVPLIVLSSHKVRRRAIDQSVLLTHIGRSTFD